MAKVFSLKRNVQKLMRVEQNMRNLQKGPFLQGGNGHRSCGETFQFEQNVKKWSRVEQNARNLQKGPFLQGRNERRDPWRKFSV